MLAKSNERLAKVTKGGTAKNCKIFIKILFEIIIILMNNT